MHPLTQLPGNTAHPGYETARCPGVFFLRLSSLGVATPLDPDRLQRKAETEAPCPEASSLQAAVQSHPRALRSRDHLRTREARVRAYYPSCMTRPRVSEPIHISLLSTNHVYGPAAIQDSAPLAPTSLCR